MANSAEKMTIRDIFGLKLIVLVVVAKTVNRDGTFSEKSNEHLFGRGKEATVGFYMAAKKKESAANGKLKTMGVHSLLSDVSDQKLERESKRVRVARLIVSAQLLTQFKSPFSLNVR